MTGTIGTLITIEGHGFGKNEEIRVDFGTTMTIILPLPRASSIGTFVFSFTANAQVNGPNRILATGINNNENGYATFTTQVHVTTFKPTFGSVGTIVTIIGDGYSGSETVRISLGTNKTITTITSNAAGEFSTTFTIDTQPMGTTSVIAYGLNCQQDESRTFRILTNIVIVSPSQGTVGRQILVTGNGYQASEVIRVDFGKVTTMTTVTTDNRGYFETSWTIDTQKFGTTTITAAGMEQSEKTLLVRSNIILVTPTRATVGTIITVAGNGYGDNEDVRIDFGYTQSIQATLSNSNGEFNTTWTLDTQPAGTTTIVATGAVSREVSQDKLFIYSNIITVSPSIGSVGTVITVQGTGYGATESVAIDLGWTVTRTTTTTDYSGYFSTTMTIDAQPCGTTTVMARGVISGEIDIDSLVIFSNIYEVSPVWGMVGELVTIYADGFGAGEPIEVNFGITPTITQATTDNTGSFVGIWTIDVQPAGWTTITAYGMGSGEVAANKYRISAKITLLTPSSGSVGTIVRVNGNAFIATDLVKIDLGWTKAITEVVCDDLGVFSTTFTIDTQPLGTRTVMANSTKNLDLYAFQIFTVEPHIIAVTPNEGTVGTLITVKGDGYAATETVRIDFGLTTSMTSVATDYRGGFEKTWTIDIQPYDVTIVKATGMDSHGMDDDSLKIIGNITGIVPSFGSVGSRVTVTGNGFAVEEPINIYFGVGIITDTNTNDHGEWTAHFTVNTQPAGTTTVSVVALSSPQELLGGFYIHGNVLSMTPIDGTVGTGVFISGNGYGAGEDIRISLGETITRGMGNASSYGVFGFTFTIDTQPSGPKTATAFGIISGEIDSTRVFTIVPRIDMVTPSQGSVGSLVSVYGSGYWANEGIRVDFGKSVSMAVVSTENSGAFAAGFTVDTQIYGTTTVVAEGTGSRIPRFSSFFIRGNVTNVLPNQGTIGTVITVLGNGYGPSENISMYLDIYPEPVVKTDNTGSFISVFSINAQPGGTKTITARGANTAEFKSNTFLVKARVLMISPTSGTVGTAITINGDGYNATENVKINFGITQPITTVLATNAGVFSAMFTFDTQAYGTTTVQAVGLKSGLLDNQWIVITQRVILVTPNNGTVGCQIEVRGNGYGSSEMVSIGFGTTTTISQVTAGQNGLFIAIWTATEQFFGSKTITATGLWTSRVDYGYFAITPKVIVLPSKGTIGTMITVNGTGYRASENVRVDFGLLKYIATVQTNNIGSFEAIFAVDTQGYGSTTIMITGLGAGSPMRVATCVFDIMPQTFITPLSGTVGQMVIVSGNGWGYQEAVSVDFGITASIVAAMTNNKGTFATTFSVDVQPAGMTTITVTGINSKQVFVNSFLITSKIAAYSPTTGTIGTIVTLTGNGYLPNETVEVTFGWTRSISIAQADDSGVFNSGFTVDVQPCGNRTIVATGVVSNNVSRAPFNIMPNITMVTPVAGTVGSMVLVTGNGYGDSEFMEITFGTNNNILIFESTSDGRWTADFMVDSQPMGATNITALGLNSNQSATSSFTITPLIGVTPNMGTVGQVVVVWGTGYPYGEVIIVDFGNTGTIAQTFTGDDGSFAWSFVINTQVYGTTTVKATSIPSNVSLATMLTILPHIAWITPEAATVGTVVTIDGDGFAANDSINIIFGTNQSIVGTSSNLDGSFVVTWTVDEQAYGSRTITGVGVATPEHGFGYLKILPEVVSIIPTTGTVGTIVTVKASGMPDNEYLWIDFGLSPNVQGPIAPAAYGTMTAMFVVDTQSCGTTTITVRDTVVEAYRQFYIDAKIYSPVPASGIVGSTVSIRGDGYGAGEVVKIGFGTTASIVSVGATEFGTFATTFVVNTQPRGLTTITATGLNTGEVDSRAFTIVPEITLVTPKRATVGTMISVVGNGFVASCPIMVDLGTTQGIGTATTNAVGSFATTFVVNTQPAGTTSVVVSDSIGSDEDRIVIYSEIIRITPIRATVGTIISVAGTGYGSSEQVKIDFGWTKSIATVTTINTGYFETTITVNVQPCGTTTVIMTGVQSGEVNQKMVVIYSHIVTVTPTNGTVGTMVNINGDGFRGSETVKIDLGQTISRTITVCNYAGAFGTTFTIDVQPYGTTSIVTTGIDSGEMARDYFHIEPNITSIAPRSGIVTTTITITGNGYGASETVRVRFGQTTTITTVTASRWGAWTVSFTVDKQPTGDKTITACGTLFNEKAYEHFTIISGLFISPEVGTVGTIITVNGSGYEDSEQVRIDLGNTKSITLVAANTAGLFTTTFTVNLQRYGTSSVSATGANSGQASTAKFFITPEITNLTPTKGSVGTRVTVDCTGYGTGEQIQLDFGKTISYISSNASIDGTFTIVWTVDTQTYGTKSVVV
ncbi:hypothetical protein COZ13_00880, partial [Candidatus Desantisbacteria bacterium CG_4_10_14_3_um_filter_40_18]